MKLFSIMKALKNWRKYQKQVLKESALQQALDADREKHQQGKAGDWLDPDLADRARAEEEALAASAGLNDEALESIWSEVLEKLAEVAGFAGAAGVDKATLPQDPTRSSMRRTTARYRRSPRAMRWRGPMHRRQAFIADALGTLKKAIRGGALVLVFLDLIDISNEYFGDVWAGPNNPTAEYRREEFFQAVEEIMYIITEDGESLFRDAAQMRRFANKFRGRGLKPGHPPFSKIYENKARGKVEKAPRRNHPCIRIKIGF